MKNKIAESASVLSAQTLAEIDQWMLRYPPEQKRSAVLQALRLAQQQNGGWLTEALMDAVTYKKYLNL